MKKINVILIIFLFFNFAGCLSTPGKSFSDAKIQNIEINTVALSSDLGEIEKFRQEILEQLHKKGYKTIVKDWSFQDWHPYSQIKNNMSQSLADSLMILRVGTEKSNVYSEKNELLGEQLTKLHCHYFLYNRNADIILWADTSYLFTIDSGYYSSHAINRFGTYEPLTALTKRLRYTESENEFRSRVAASLTQNIPPSK